MQNTDTILIVMVAVTGALVLLQFIVLLVIFFAMRRALHRASEYAGEFRSSVAPVLEHSAEVLQVTKQLISRLEPKLDAAASDLAELAHGVRGQMVKIEASADEITERVRRQVARIDGMTTSTLNGVDRAGRFLNDAVSVPVRQVSGIMAAAKAIVETLRSPGPVNRGSHRSAPSRPARANDENNVPV